MKLFRVCAGAEYDRNLVRIVSLTETLANALDRLAQDFGGGNMVKGRGCYRMDNGSTVFENSVVFEIYTEDKTGVLNFAKWLRACINAESVLVSSQDVLLTDVRDEEAARERLQP